MTSGMTWLGKNITCQNEQDKMFAFLSFFLKICIYCVVLLFTQNKLTTFGYIKMNVLAYADVVILFRIKKGLKKSAELDIFSRLSMYLNAQFSNKIKKLYSTHMFKSTRAINKICKQSLYLRFEIFDQKRSRLYENKKILMNHGMIKEKNI